MTTRLSPLLSNTAARKLSNLIAQKVLGETTVDIGFSSNIFMIFGLPARRPAGNPAGIERYMRRLPGFVPNDPTASSPCRRWVVP